METQKARGEVATPPTRTYELGQLVCLKMFYRRSEASTDEPWLQAPRCEHGTAVGYSADGELPEGHVNFMPAEPIPLHEIYPVRHPFTVSPVEFSDVLPDGTQITCRYIVDSTEAIQRQTA